jgi:hypothetical protein
MNPGMLVDPSEIALGILSFIYDYGKPLFDLIKPADDTEHLIHYYLAG